MTDRWVHDRSRSQESRGQRYDFDRHGHDYRFFNEYNDLPAQDRSFQPSIHRDERRTEGYDRGRVFGERESGAGYGGQAHGGRYYGDAGRSPLYGAGYGQGERSGSRYAADGYGGDDRRYEAGPGDAGYSQYTPRHFGGAMMEGGHTYAEQVALRRGGNRGLGPSGYKRSDARISEDLHERLTDDDHLDASRIQVAVADGEVTLSGTVASRHDKHHAEHLAERVGGVDHVQNNLRVERRDNPDANPNYDRLKAVTDGAN